MMTLSPEITFILGIVILVAGAEGLVRSASRLAVVFGVSPLIIGLTVVAFGTSAPELAIGVIGVAGGQPDVGFGGIVGSSIFNILFILGMGALICPLIVHRQIVRLDVPLLILAAVIALVVSFDGRVGFVDGMILLAVFAAYLGVILNLARREIANSAGAASDSTPRRRGVVILQQVMLLIISLAAIIAGSRWVVSGAAAIARDLGVSEFIVGLTIIAGGTSLPEIATSLVAALRRQQDIAVGNIIGSCIFNILAVLGVMAVISDGITVPAGALGFDLPVMLACAVVCLPLFFTGYRISRWEGAVLLAYYVAYLGFVLLAAADHDALPLFSWIMAVFVLPLTAMTLLIVTWRAFTERR